MIFGYEPVKLFIGDIIITRIYSFIDNKMNRRADAFTDTIILQAFLNKQVNHLLADYFGKPFEPII